MASNLRVKYEMLKLGFNQKELGQLINVSQSQISRLINGTELDPDYQKEIIEKMRKKRGVL